MIVNVNIVFFLFFFFIIKIVGSVVLIIIVVIVLVKNDAHFEKFFAFITSLRLLHLFSKLFREFKSKFFVVDRINMTIIFTSKSSFLVTNNSIKKLVFRRGTFTLVSILFNKFHIIHNVARILVSFFTNRKNDSLDNIFNIIFRIIIILRHRYCSLVIRRIIAGSNDLTSIGVVIIVKKGLKELTAFGILAFDDNIRIVSVIVEHTYSIVRFVFTDRSVLFSESETPPGLRGSASTEVLFVRALDDIFKDIVFSIFMVFDVL